MEATRVAGMMSGISCPQAGMYGKKPAPAINQPVNLCTVTGAQKGPLQNVKVMLSCWKVYQLLK